MGGKPNIDQSDQELLIKNLTKQLETNLGWKQLVANKFRKQVVIQDSEIETIHKKLVLIFTLKLFGGD